MIREIRAAFHESLTSQGFVEGKNVTIEYRWAKGRSFEVVDFATLEWIDWFNNRRLMEPIGYVPPAEAEKRYYTTLNEQNWQREPNETASHKPRGGSLARVRIVEVSCCFGCRER